MAYLKSFIKRAPLVVREYLPSFGNNITLFAVFSFAQKFYEFLVFENQRFSTVKIKDFYTPKTLHLRVFQG